VTQRRRRRSRDVALVALPALALAFSACGGDEDTAYCVDENDQIVENQYCDDEAYADDDDNVGGFFFWYYGGSVVGGRVVRGAKVRGGDRVSASNVAENVRRGGFGSSSRNSGGVGRPTASANSGGG
jgi:hypothetical protein